MAKQVEPPPRRSIEATPENFAKATNIDRRTCRRTVPEMWIEAIQAKFVNTGTISQRKDWDQLLGHCQAVTDIPCAPLFANELLGAYPDTHVILTVRDSPEQWYESMTKTVMPDAFEVLYYPAKSWAHWLWRKFLPPTTPIDRLQNLFIKHCDMYRCLHEDMQTGSRTAIKWYDNYYAEIQRRVPKDQLLVMNVKEGWEPLCRHLGKEVPPWSFPVINTRDHWDQNIKGMNKGLNILVAIGVAKTLAPVVVAAAAVGVFWVVRK